MTSTVLDYADRQVDLVAWHNIPVTRETLLRQTLVEEGESGNIIAGKQKLLQWVLGILFQEQGTKLYAPLEGTTFMTRLRLGYIRTTLDAEQAFQSALVDIRRQLLQSDSEDMPDDERLQDVELLSVVHTGDKVVLRFKVTSLAGTSITALTPLPVAATSRPIPE